MGRFAYGWPKNYGLPIEGSNGDTVQSIEADPSGKFMMTVTDTKVLVWAAKMHRVLLGSYTLQSGDEMVGACWGQSGSKIAIAGVSGAIWILQLSEVIPTDGRHGLLDFETTQARELSSVTNAKLDRILPVTFSLIEEIRIRHAGALTCIGACVVGALFGTSKGNLGCISWEGDVLWRIHVPELLRNQNAFLKMGVSTHKTEDPDDAEQNIKYFIEESTDGSGGSIAALCYCKKLDLCGVVTNTGLSFLLHLGMGGERSPSALNGRWLRSTKSVCIDIEPTRMIAAVGLSDGDVQQFFFGIQTGTCCPVVRTLSLSNWYFEPADVGCAKVVSWAPDGTAIVVGWEKRGLAVWSLSGCRLMWTLPQIGGPIPTTPGLRSGSQVTKLAHTLDEGTTAVSWSPFGFFLWAAPRKEATASESVKIVHFVEFSFYKSVAICSSCQNDSTRLALLGPDRILLLEYSEMVSLRSNSSLQPENGHFDWKHLSIPHDYLSGNYPPRHMAVNDTSSHIAFAATNGVGICHIRSQRWRFFGDLDHDRRIRCCALSWYGKSIIIGNEVAVSRGAISTFRSQNAHYYELLFYSRDDMNFSSLQARIKLPSKPLLLDVRPDGYLLVLCHNHTLLIYQLTEHYSRGSLSIREMNRLSLVAQNADPLSKLGTHDRDASSLLAAGESIIAARLFPSVDQSEALPSLKPQVIPAPQQVMLLKSTGLLLLLDLKRMTTIPLLRRVEQFWYTPARCPPFDSVEQRPLWWAYSDEGIHVCFRDGMKHLFAQENGDPPVNGHLAKDKPVTESESEHRYSEEIGVEQWFEVDPEVYPLGLMEGFGMILGATQGLLMQSISGSGLEVPKHVIKIKRQPVLHTLLRHLLMRSTNDDRTALRVALKCLSLPQFVDSLEWLLYEAVLDHDYGTESVEQGGRRAINAGDMGTPDHGRGTDKFFESVKVGVSHSSIVPMSPGRAGSNLGLFPRVIRLLKYFGEYEDVVVRCARKMDSKRWPLLFSLAGEPAALLEQCFVSGRLRTAACLLVILQEMWGFISSTPHSLRLLDAAIERGALNLASDLVKFLSKADQAGMLNSSQLRTNEDVSWISRANNVNQGSIKDDQSVDKRRFPAVDVTVLKHIRRLLPQLELRKVGALARRMNFPLGECLKREYGTKKGNRPLVRDFGGTILALHRQFQWGEPSSDMVLRAIDHLEAKRERYVPNVDGAVNGEPVRNKISSSNVAKDREQEILVPPDRNESIGLKRRKLRKEELVYLLQACTTSGAWDLTLCVSTLLLEVDSIVTVLGAHDDTCETYIAALRELNTSGYNSLAKYLEDNLRSCGPHETRLVAPIEDTTL